MLSDLILTFSIFCVYFCIAIAIQPENRLRRLDIPEREEIRRKCYPDNTDDRILGGNASEQGMFPFSALIIDRELDGECGASLISWRHLITAKHCLNRFADPNPIEVYIGGLCIAKGVGPCKKPPYMEKLEVESVFWLGNPASSSPDDHAIVQLKEEVPKKLQKRVQFACLPRRSEAMPEFLTIQGWGNTTEGDSSEFLRYATLSVMPATQCYDDGLICAKRVRSATIPTQRTGVGEGDSGGGAVLFDPTVKKHTVYGITVTAAYMKKYDLYVSIFVKISPLLDFYCEYLSLCVPKYWVGI